MPLSTLPTTLNQHDPFELVATKSIKDEVLSVLQNEIQRLNRQCSMLEKSSPDILERAVATFESVEAAALWLATPQRFAQENTPVELAQTPDGKDAVLAQLDRIDHGVYM